MDFQTCLGQIFKYFEFLWLPVKGGHCHCEGFEQFRDSFDVVIETGKNAVSGQLLKGQRKLFCFNCRRGVLTAQLWLNWGARLLLFSCRFPWGAVGNLFLNSCHLVMCLFLIWFSLATGTTGRKLNFGIRISQGMIPNAFRIYLVVVPRCSGNNYGTNNNLLVQKRIIKFTQGTQ